MAHKIEIPEDLTQPFLVPDGATVSQLTELAAEAQDRALALLGDDDSDPSQEALDQARYLQGVLAVVQGAQGELEQAAAERKKMVDELRSQMRPGEAEGDGGQPAQAPSPTDVVPEAVVAAGQQPVRVPTYREIAGEVGKPEMPINRGHVVLTAAANVPGFVAGAELETEQLGQAFESRASVLAAFKGKAGKGSEQVRVQHGFATIRTDVADQGLVAGAHVDSDGVDLSVQYAIDHYIKSLAAKTGQGIGALVAAGWCAPSQVIYDLLNLSTAEGLLTLPEISVERGGLKWATGPDFGTVYGSGMFTTLTETQAIAGNTLANFDIPCPSPTESRMNADALYLKADILSNKGWPEAITDFITKALIAWQHYVSAKTIADLVAGSQAVNLSQFGTGNVAPEFGAIPTVLGGLELQVEDMRYRMRLSRSVPIEVVLPYFARGILRSDMAKRLDDDGGTSVGITDAQLDNWFAVRGMNPQFVYDWQDNIASGGTANPFGNMAASGYATTWPQTLQAIIYAPGTWARALTPVIELSTLYDSTLLTSNQYVGLFTEQGRLTIKRGFDSRVVTLASNPSGVTGGYATPASPQASTPI